MTAEETVVVLGEHLLAAAPKDEVCVRGGGLHLDRMGTRLGDSQGVAIRKDATADRDPMQPRRVDRYVICPDLAVYRASDHEFRRNRDGRWLLRSHEHAEHHPKRQVEHHSVPPLHRVGIRGSSWVRALRRSSTASSALSVDARSTACDRIYGDVGSGNPAPASHVQAPMTGRRIHSWSDRAPTIGGLVRSNAEFLTTRRGDRARCRRDARSWSHRRRPEPYLLMQDGEQPIREDSTRRRT